MRPFNYVPDLWRRLESLFNAFLDFRGYTATEPVGWVGFHSRNFGIVRLGVQTLG